MNRKIVFVIIILLATVPTAMAAPTERENYHHGDTYDARTSARGNNYVAQTFTTPSPLNSSHTVTSIYLYSGRRGSVTKTTNIYIYATGIDSKPTGSALTSGSRDTSDMGTMGWYQWTVSPEIVLSVNTKYAIVLTCTTGDSTNSVSWGYDDTDGYASGEFETSNNAGSTWTIYSWDGLFQIWGNDATASMTFTSTYTGSGYIEVNGSPETTPYTDTYVVGESVLIEALSPRVKYADVERHVYVSWSDSGAQIHNYTVPTGGATVTANYKKQFKHIIDADPIAGDDIVIFNGTDQESPFRTDWIDTNTEFGIDAYLLPVGSTGYCFDYWSDLLTRDHSVQPTTAANYTAFYEVIPPWDATLLITGNATITFEGSPVTTPEYFNLTAGESYTVNAVGGAGSGSSLVNFGLMISLIIVFALIFALLLMRREH